VSGSTRVCENPVSRIQAWQSARGSSGLYCGRARQVTKRRSIDSVSRDKNRSLQASRPLFLHNGTSAYSKRKDRPQSALSHGSCQDWQAVVRSRKPLERVPSSARTGCPSRQGTHGRFETKRGVGENHLGLVAHRLVETGCGSWHRVFRSG
jgi:hypothetical protein